MPSSIYCMITDDRKGALTKFRADQQARGFFYHERQVIEALIDMIPELGDKLVEKLKKNKGG